MFGRRHRDTKGAPACTADLEKRYRTLCDLIEINTYIANSLEKEEVLKRILQQTKVLLDCEGSSILLVDRVMGRLNFAVMSREEEADTLRDTNLRMGEGIAGTVWQNGIPILINDAQNDPRFSDRADRKSRTITRSILAVPLTVNGEIIGVIEAINKIGGTFNDFDLQLLQSVSTQSAIAINNADLYDMAIRDGMTRLFIRRYFKLRMEEEWNRSVRQKHSLAVVMFDIDRFKGINDTYGHRAGDRAIKEVARIIQANSRSIDIPCRYGGEEFTVILPETGRNEAVTFADRIRASVEGLRLEHEECVIPFTVSAGVAAIPDVAAVDAGELLAMADRALYAAKNGGRNRVIFFEGSMAET